MQPERSRRQLACALCHKMGSKPCEHAWPDASVSCCRSPGDSVTRHAFTNVFNQDSAACACPSRWRVTGGDQHRRCARSNRSRKIRIRCYPFSLLPIRRLANMPPGTYARRDLIEIPLLPGKVSAVFSDAAGPGLLTFHRRP